MSFFFRRKRPVYQIGVDEKKTWIVYDRILELLKKLDLSGTDLSYDATVHDDPLLEINIAFRTSHADYYDCMEFWVEPEDDVLEKCGWVEQELSKTVDRRRQELKGSPAGGRPGPSSQASDQESVYSERFAEYDASSFKFFCLFYLFFLSQCNYFANRLDVQTQLSAPGGVGARGMESLRTCHKHGSCCVSGDSEIIRSLEGTKGHPVLHLL